MQQEEFAIEDLKQAIQSEPTAKVIRRSLAGLLYEMGYVQDAMEQCEALLAADPNDELAMLTLVRCLQDEARVSGTVTLDGKPLADAAVGFFADAGGTPAVGTTDAQGKFTLSTHNPGDGATQGQNVVTVSKQSNLDAGKEVEESEIVRMKNESPVRYFSPKTSDIKIEVKYGMEPVTIDLNSGK